MEPFMPSVMMVCSSFPHRPILECQWLQSACAGCDD